MTWLEQLQRRDQEVLCEKAGVQPTPANLQRIFNARSIMAHNRVRYIQTDADGTKHFEVGSQNDESKTYHVSFNGSLTTCCDCEEMPDADRSHHCQHGLAVRLAWNLNRYRIDKERNPLSIHSKAQLKHKLDRMYGAGNWKIQPKRTRHGQPSQRQGRVYVKGRNGQWRKTILNIEKRRHGLYYMGRW